jgi:hypothetical protein
MKPSKNPKTTPKKLSKNPQKSIKNRKKFTKNPIDAC